MISQNLPHTTPLSPEAHTPVLSTLTPYQAVAIMDNLQQQLDVYRLVLDVLLQKKVSLLKQSITDLPTQDKVLKKQRKQLDALEEQRTQMLQAFWPHALEPTQVANLQEETQRLLHASLDWVNQSMAWVKQHMQGGQKELTYTAQGKTKKNKSISTMQRQV